MKRSEQIDRNSQIIQMRLDGKSPKEIGNTFGLTETRAYQILKNSNIDYKKIIKCWSRFEDRNSQMLQMRLDKKILQEIGDAFGLSRERVRQVLKKYHNKGGKLEREGGITCPICSKTFFNTNKNGERKHCSRECQQTYLEARNREIVFLKDRNVSYQEIANIYHLAPRTISNLYWKELRNPRKRR